MADELDRLLDEALAAPPADPNLAPLVLSRIAAAPRRRWWFWAAPAAAAAAAVAVVTLVPWASNPPPPARPWPAEPYRAATVRERQAPADGHHVRESGRTRPALRAARRAAQPARLPTPAALSMEERALLRLAATPDALAKPFTDDPIVIAPIRIEPLASGEGPNI